jgi:hypothetical protein
MPTWQIEPERALSDTDRIQLEVIISALRDSPAPLTFEQLAPRTRIPAHQLKSLLGWAVRVNKLRDRQGLYEY